jgi:hypothetical protein
MKTEGWYNGYGWSERYAKLRALKRLIDRGELPLAKGPCQLCGDPDVPVEFHDEDYSQPYLWGPPALFALCRNCHRDKLHKRFARPHAWLAFIAHVRRGGYARDLAAPELRREVATLAKALSAGEPPSALPSLNGRTYASTIGEEWFANLSCDPTTVSPGGPRPRP